VSNAQDRLRQFLSPAIGGPNTDALLEALAIGDDLNDANIEAIHDQLYLVTATGRYLDRLAANVGFVRPVNVGLSDEAFSNLAVVSTATKQITPVLLDLMEIFYGPESTRAFVVSTANEPFALADGMQLAMEFDGQEPLTVTFRSTEFANITAATAKEVADTITKQIRNLTDSLAAKAYAVDYTDDTTGLIYVKLFSGAKGPSSTVRVMGGQAQNFLLFPAPLATTQTIGTQWQVAITGSALRFTWIGGTNPSLGLVNVGDIVSVFGGVFFSENRGSFEIISVVDGTVTNARFTVSNPLGIAQAVIQLAANDITFMNPVRRSILSTARYATVFEVAPNVLNVFLPATTQVVDRQLEDAAHLHLTALESDFMGPYIYDTTLAGVLTEAQTSLVSLIEPGQTYRTISVVDAVDFVDGVGYLMFDFGYDNQEGPVKYVGRPSSQLLLVDPAYSFLKLHSPGANITFLSSRAPIDLKEDGSQFPFYLTGIANGRLYAEDLIDQLVATGLTLIITILYPGDVGLGNAGLPTTGNPPLSDAVRVWGGDPP